MRFASFELRWFATIIAAIFPSGHGMIQTGADRVPMDRFLLDVSHHSPLLPLIGIRAGLWFLMFCPLLVIGRPRTFAGLALDDQKRVLDRLADSRFYPIREIPVLLKTIGCLGYGSTPAVQRELGVTLQADVPSWQHDGGAR
jgi:hypothetical protein